MLQPRLDREVSGTDVGRYSHSICNKAEYAEQRRHMLQEGANRVHSWIGGQTYVLKLMRENVIVRVLSAMA